MSTASEAGTRAAFYTRVSTDQQVAEGESLETQQALCEQYAAERGWTIVATFIEAGVSGRKEQRRELDALLAGAERGEFDHVVIYKLDRFGRTQRQLHANAGRLQDVGVSLASVSDNIDTSTDAGSQLFGILGFVAEMESRNISERVKADAARKRARGFHGGNAHYGYAKAAGVLTVRPHEAAVVQRIHAELQAGITQANIARALNADGVPTASGRGHWYQGTVRRIIKDPVPAGFNLDAEPCPCGHEEIVSPETWARSQKLTEGKYSAARRGRRATNLLFRRGMLRCGLCGESLYPRDGLYACSGQARDGEHGCSMPSVRGNVIDAAVLQHFQNVGLSLEDTCAEVAAAHDREVAEARGLLAEAERAEQQAVGRLERVKRDYMDGALPASDWQAMSAELTAEREAAASEAMRHRARAAELAEHDAFADAEQQVLEHLATVRAAIVGEVSAQDTLDGLRSALLALFEAFTLHNVRLGSANLPALIHDGLNLDTGYIIEPHVCEDAITLRSEHGGGVELRRVPLLSGATKKRRGPEPL